MHNPSPVSAITDPTWDLARKQYELSFNAEPDTNTHKSNIETTNNKSNNSPTNNMSTTNSMNMINSNNKNKKIKKVLRDVQKHRMYECLEANWNTFNTSNVSWDEIANAVNTSLGYSVSPHVVAEAMHQLSEDYNTPLESKRAKASSSKLDFSGRNEFISSILGACPRALNQEVKLQVEHMVGTIFDQIKMGTTLSPTNSNSADASTAKVNMLAQTFHGMFNSGLWETSVSKFAKDLLADIMTAKHTPGSNVNVHANFPASPNDFGTKLGKYGQELRARGFVVTSTRSAPGTIWTITPSSSVRVGRSSR